MFDSVVSVSVLYVYMVNVAFLSVTFGFLEILH